MYGTQVDDDSSEACSLAVTFSSSLPLWTAQPAMFCLLAAAPEISQHRAYVFPLTHQSTGIHAKRGAQHRSATRALCAGSTGPP